MSSQPTYVFGLLLDHSRAGSSVLRSLFRHPWIADYHLNFGPPLVRSSPALIDRIQDSKDVLDKLSIYLDSCVLDPKECSRLAEIQRKQVVKRLGPVEAEALSDASRQAIDLQLSLTPFAAADPDVQASMMQSGLSYNNTEGVTPEQLSAYFLIRLDDPRNLRFFDIPELKSRIGSHTNEAVFLELRTNVNARRYWQAFLKVLSLVTSFEPVEIGEPRSWARVRRDGKCL